MMDNDFLTNRVWNHLLVMPADTLYCIQCRLPNGTYTAVATAKGDGTVVIDWPAIESVLAWNEADPSSLGLARILMEARNSR